MAIGDTIQAGLMRVDSSPIQIAGAAQARANEAFGNALTSVATGFLEGREKKARTEEMTGYLMNQGASESDAKAIARNPFLQKEFQRKQEADQRMAIAKMQDATRRSQGGADRAQRARAMEVAENLRNKQEAKLAEQEQEKLDFTSSLFTEVPTGNLTEAGVDELGRGYVFTGGDPELVNNFVGQLKEDPNLQETTPRMNLEGNSFLQSYSGESPEQKQLALNFMQARQKEAPKPMSPIEVAELEKLNLANRKAEFELQRLNNPPKKSTEYQERTLVAIDDALKIMDDEGFRLPVAGLFAETASEIGGTDAANLKQAISTIQSSIGFDRLQRMRDDSPTGGALGQVSERELSLLTASLGSLSQLQSTPALRANLQRVRTHYDNYIKSINARNQGQTFKTIEDADAFLNSNDPSAPASKSTMDEFNRKKQMLEQRQYENQYFENPNVKRVGTAITGN